jgi:hypothetical protein
MAKQEKGTSMTDEELCSVIDQEESAATGHSTSGRLQRQRSKAMEYYLGEPFGNESPEHAEVVTREVMDTIEWIKPELMKMFASGSETVRFEPETAQDVPAAQQATDYLNYLFHRKNRGFKLLYEWITDGLLQKTGVVKVWWDQSREKVREEYRGLTEMEMQMLLSADGVELEEQEAIVDPQTGMPAYDVVILREGPMNGLKLEVLPPEEFLISRKAKDIPNSPFCAHRTRKTISELNAMGYDTKDLAGGTDTSTGVEWEDEYRARHSYDDSQQEIYQTQDVDPTTRQVWVTEAYIRVDLNKDGIAELMKVTKVGSTVLDKEEVDCMPFAGWTPIIISHKFHGLSMADLTMDLQRIQSQLFRNMLDNQYLTNNGRYEVLEGQVNMGDMLTSSAHGIVRTKISGAVRRLDVPQLGNTAFQMLDYVDRLREKRTGVSERTQGMDPNQLNANTAATAVNQVMTAAQQRIELIARVFGETGLTDLFHLMYKYVIQYQTDKDIFRLRDEYIEVDPSEWRERKDTSVVVGLGNGSREQEMLQLNMVVQNQQQMAANPQFADVVTPANVYNALEDQVKVFDKASAGRYFTDPTSEEAQQAAKARMEQMQQQQQQQEAMLQMQQQLEQQKVAIDQLTAQGKNQRLADQTRLEEQELAQKEEHHQDEITLKSAQIEKEYELEKEQGRGVDLG